MNRQLRALHRADGCVDFGSSLCQSAYLLEVPHWLVERGHLRKLPGEDLQSPQERPQSRMKHCQVAAPSRARGNPGITSRNWSDSTRSSEVRAQQFIGSTHSLMAVPAGLPAPLP